MQDDELPPEQIVQRRDEVIRHMLTTVAKRAPNSWASRRKRYTSARFFEAEDVGLCLAR